MGNRAEQRRSGKNRLPSINAITLGTPQELTDYEGRVAGRRSTRLGGG